MSISMLEKEKVRAIVAYEAMKSNRDYYDRRLSSVLSGYRMDSRRAETAS